MPENLYITATEIVIRVAILRAHYKIDKDSADIIAALAELIRVKLRSNSPNYSEIAELSGEITQAIRDSENSTQGGIYL